MYRFYEIIALCIGFVGADALELQQKISLTKGEDKLAIIDCFFPSDCWSYIHWYQQKDGETFKRMLYSDISNGETKNDAGFESVKSEKKASNHFVLKITKLQKIHSAVYYCACWNSYSTVSTKTQTHHKNLRNPTPQKARLDNLAIA